MTWCGVQGFLKYPDETLCVPQHPIRNNNSLLGYGHMSIWTVESGLIFYVSSFAGHEGPWYTPGVAFRVLQKLLGRTPNLIVEDSF